MMAHATDDKSFQARIARLETLLAEVERYADPLARAHTREIVQAILELHGTGLERILEQIAATGEEGLSLIDTLARDDLVGSLLLLYGIHPLDVEARVRQALEEVRPALRSHGGNVELLGVSGTVVRLQLHGSCDGCPSSAATMQQTIREAVFARAPEVTAVELDGQVEHPPAAAVAGARLALPLV
jgi:Fe-S cluster biogenesis protein NfuA